MQAKAQRARATAMTVMGKSPPPATARKRIEIANTTNVVAAIMVEFES